MELLPSDAMLDIFEMIERVASSDSTVLITGESGTGKELCARALHNLGQNKNGRFVAINCAAIPDTLLESELFGYEKGAFTGANKQTKGKIERVEDFEDLIIAMRGRTPIRLSDVAWVGDEPF